MTESVSTFRTFIEGQIHRDDEYSTDSYKIFLNKAHLGLVGFGEQYRKERYFSKGDKCRIVMSLMLRNWQKSFGLRILKKT